jgi:hypothetical protein
MSATLTSRKSRSRTSPVISDARMWPVMATRLTPITGKQPNILDRSFSSVASTVNRTDRGPRGHLASSRSRGPMATPNWLNTFRGTRIASWTNDLPQIWGHQHRTIRSRLSLWHLVAFALRVIDMLLPTSTRSYRYGGFLRKH